MIIVNRSGSCASVLVFVESFLFSVFEVDWCNTDLDCVDASFFRANIVLDVESHSSRAAEGELRHSTLCICGQ